MMTVISVYHSFRGPSHRQYSGLSGLVLVVALVVFSFAGSYVHTRLPAYRQFVQAGVARDQRNHSFSKCLVKENP